MHRNNFESKTAAVKPYISEKNKQKRYETALEWSRWPFKKFRNIIFSHESKFEVHYSSKKGKIWRKRGKNNMKKIYVTLKNLQNIKIWCGVALVIMV